MKERKTKSKNDISNNGNVYYDADADGGWMDEGYGGIEKITRKTSFYDERASSFW